MKCDKCKNKAYCDEHVGIRRICKRNGYNSFVMYTNADRIRAMSDVEMAKLFGLWVADCDNEDVPCKKYCDEYKSCGDTWLAWLKEGVKDG